jgi:protein-S-isoprenylcysteine O-methyltransferase Ste14
MYLSFAMVSLGLALLTQHWLGVVLGAMLGGLLLNDMRREKQANLDKFGVAYRDYMQRVPRVNILAGLLRAAPTDKDVEQNG